jgi:hypothetical protein
MALHSSPNTYHAVFHKISLALNCTDYLNTVIRVKKERNPKNPPQGNNYGSVKMCRSLSSVVCPQSASGQRVPPPPETLPVDGNFRAHLFYSNTRGAFFKPILLQFPKNVRKMTIFLVMCVRLSVCPHQIRRLPPDGLLKSFLFGIFNKISRHFLVLLNQTKIKHAI